MKLYVYDHCPFCVRARMPFGLKAIPFEMVVLPNDDEATPIGMIGRKMLPILEDDQGVLGESLAIVAKLDALGGPRLFDGAPATDIAAWLARWDPLINDLVIPRTPDPVYAEFRGAASRAYFTAKKEARFGAFDGLLARTEEFKAALSPALDQLAPILPDPEHPGIDDIVLFPVLRSLTIMPDLAFPGPVAAYLQRMSERAGVPLVTALRAMV
ncbi:glutaredoxin 2 [Novosphingobium sp. 1949]|uniref:Glutaredoxin 2 n=1 Tax=Novosphingobium organovorum TaxID=2930092 RepID=A0ABT0BBW2_9SPHN|nr:glutaredoxin 2 [Novosphingobium organovorum]MCJ2182540.1 glutaredoxin 2 [Novosphingobium organovorum]